MTYASVDLVRRLRSLQHAGALAGFSNTHDALLPDSGNNPHELARRVLAYCRKDLALDPRTAILWTDLEHSWGMVNWRLPHVVQLSHRLRNASPAEVVETVAHECRHAWAYRIGAINQADHAAEQDALAYGRHILALWT